MLGYWPGLPISRVGQEKWPKYQGQAIDTRYYPKVDDPHRCHTKQLDTSKRSPALDHVAIINLILARKPPSRGLPGVQKKSRETECWKVAKAISAVYKKTQQRQTHRPLPFTLQPGSNPRLPTVTQLSSERNLVNHASQPLLSQHSSSSSWCQRG